MEEYPLIADLALILIAAGCTSIICKLTKLPVIVGYLVAGLLTGPAISLFPTVTDNASIHTWSEIGVIFLLFALGLEFNFKSLIKVGKTGAITAVTILFGVMLASFGLGAILDWSMTQSIFMGGMLAISSTMVAVKAFEELKLKGQPFTHIVYGVEVVEDIVAILLMVILPMLALSQSDSLAREVTSSIMRVIFFMSIWFLGGIFLVPTLLRKLKQHLSDELLLVIALALCFGMVMLADGAGLSTALGAFVIGAILGTTPQAHHVEGLMAPLKNLFGAIFFVSVGMLADPSVILDHWGTILLCLAVVIIVQPIAAMIGIFGTGKNLKDSVKAGLSFGNIGEFSFIIANLGIAHHILESYVYPVVIVVCVITTISMPNMLKLANPLAGWLEKKLPTKLTQRGLEQNNGEAPKANASKLTVLLKQFAFETFIMSVLIIGVIALFVGFIEPHALPALQGLLTDRLDPEYIVYASKGLLFLLMLMCMMPFLSALVVRKSNMSKAFFVVLLKGKQRGLLRILRMIRLVIIIAFIGIAIIANSPFNWWINAIIGVVVLGLVLFFKGIFSNYMRLERQFLFNYNEVEMAERENNTQARTGEQLGSLTNIREGDWFSSDFSVGHIRVDEDSVFLGKTLRELDLRAKLELYVLRIERDHSAVNIPSGDITLAIDDVIYIVGKREALNQLKDDPYNVSSKKLHIESMSEFTTNLQERRTDEANLRCIALPIEKDSGLCGKTIRDSGIVQNHCLIIGIEVADRVEMSPKPDEELQAGQRVWVVGDFRGLGALLEANLPSDLFNSSEFSVVPENA